MASSSLNESSMLSSSEELDVLSIEASDIGDSPVVSPQYEKLMEVVSRAGSKLNIDCQAEKWEAQRKDKLDERFLQSEPQPPCRVLPFSHRSPH